MKQNGVDIRSNMDTAPPKQRHEYPAKTRLKRAKAGNVFVD
jgi:hypothetical protein